MRQVDDAFATSLQWILDNDVTELELVFTTQDGTPLVEGGESVAVTNDNKVDYIARVVKNRLVDSVLPQLNALVAGFRTLVPAGALQDFSASGSSELSIGSALCLNASYYLQN